MIKILLAIYGICGAYGLALGEERLSIEPSIAVGYDYLCVSDGIPGNGPWCATEAANSAITRVPAEVRTVIALSAGAIHGCAIYLDADSQARKLACWGDNRLGQSQVPAMADGEEPVEVVSGSWHNCVLMRDKNSARNHVQCFGGNNPDLLAVPQSLQNPRHIAANGNLTCATDRDDHGQDRVFCWGENFNSHWQAAIFDLNADDVPWCEKTSAGFTCRTQRLGHRENDDPLPLAISRAQNHNSCGLGGTNAASAMICRIVRDGSFEDKTLQIPGKTYDFGMSLTRACVLHENGVSCWQYGQDQFQPLEINGQYLRKDLFLQTPFDIRAIILRLTPEVYSFDADYFRDISHLLQRASEQQLRLAIRALSPLLSDFPYRGIFEERMTKMAASIRLVLGNDGEPAVTSQEDRLFAINLLATTIRTMRPVLLRIENGKSGVNQMREAEEIVALLGQSAATGGSVARDLQDRLAAFGNDVALNTYVGDRSPTIAWLTQKISGKE